MERSQGLALERRETPDPVGCDLSMLHLWHKSSGATAEVKRSPRPQTRGQLFELGTNLGGVPPRVAVTIGESVEEVSEPSSGVSGGGFVDLDLLL